MLAGVALGWVPPTAEAPEWLRRVRPALGHGPLGRCDPHRAAAALGWPVRTVQLGAARGGTQAMLVPRAGGFECLVDPDLTPSQHWLVPERARGSGRSVKQAVGQFRLAHELAHSLFYSSADGDRFPCRLLAASGAEEAFCDAFAAAMLIGELGTSNGARASDAFRIASSRRVCLETAAVALAAGDSAITLAIGRARAVGGPAPALEFKFAAGSQGRGACRRLPATSADKGACGAWDVSTHGTFAAAMHGAHRL